MLVCSERLWSCACQDFFCQGDIKILCILTLEYHGFRSVISRAFPHFFINRPTPRFFLFYSELIR